MIDARRLRRIDGLEFQECGDDVLVHDGHAGSIHVLNRTAAEILLRCDGASVSELIDAIMSDEPIDRTVVTRDVVAVLEQFASLGLITLDG